MLPVHVKSRRRHPQTRSLLRRSGPLAGGGRRRRIGGERRRHRLRSLPCHLLRSSGLKGRRRHQVADRLVLLEDLLVADTARESERCDQRSCLEG